MKRFQLLAFSLACAGCVVQVSSNPVTQQPAADPKGKAEPEAQEGPRYSAAQFHETTRVRGTSFSPDESKILITSDKTGVPNVYAQPVQGGEPVALTSSSTVANRGISYFPQDERFLFAADGGGDELSHIFVGEQGKAPVDLTPGKGFLVRFGGWSGDKKSFWVQSNERDKKSFDLYAFDVKTLKRTMIFKNEGGVTPVAVSPDLRYIAINKSVDNADSNFYLIDTKAKNSSPELISKHEGKAQYKASHFSNDSAKLYYSTNAHSEWDQFWTYDLKSKKHELLAKSDWDVITVAFSDKDRYRTEVINQDARFLFRVLNNDSQTALNIPNLPAGSITSSRFSPSENKLAFYAATDRTPSDLYVLDIPSQKLQRLTNNLNPAIDPEQLVDAEIIRFPSYDGVQIPNILWKPKKASVDHKVPVMLYIHGGPGGQTYASYKPTVQYLVNQGYAVLAVNNRGSSGYGKTFFHLDDQRHGDADLKDCLAAKKYLQGLDWVDPEKIGIMGGSYGGYMTLAALAFHPQEFRVGVDIFGVANWIRTLESIPPWWDAFRASLWAEIGDPVKDRARLEKFSPLLHANKIQKPLLVIQGANDPRVLKVESDEIVAAVKKSGVPVEYVVFPDEGHGFAKRSNNIVADEAIKRFLDQQLAAPKSDAQSPG